VAKSISPHFKGIQGIEFTWTLSGFQIVMVHIEQMSIDLHACFVLDDHLHDVPGWLSLDSRTYVHDVANGSGGYYPVFRVPESDLRPDLGVLFESPLQRHGPVLLRDPIL
jgi:hypothetical protein